jgi:hypothetical protein
MKKNFQSLSWSYNRVQLYFQRLLSDLVDIVYEELASEFRENRRSEKTYFT